MTDRINTEHSPRVVETYERLRQEWSIQKAMRDGASRRAAPDTPQTRAVFKKAALFCVNHEIDPARLVSATLDVCATQSIVSPTWLMSDAVRQRMNTSTGKDDEGRDHILMDSCEANYRSEIYKIAALINSGTNPAFILDQAYAFRPLVCWVFAKKRGFDPTAFYLDAREEYQRNHLHADKVFGDVVKGLK